MSQDLVVHKSEGLVDTIIKAEAKAAELQKQLLECKAQADTARLQVMELFRKKGLKTVKTSGGIQVTVAKRRNIRITDPALARESLVGMQLSKQFLELIPAHHEIKEKEFKKWIAEKLPTEAIDEMPEELAKHLQGVDVSDTEYLVVKQPK